MALPSAVQGGRRPSALLTWYQEDGTTPEDITGATLTGSIRRGRGAATVVAITGVLTVIDAANGVFRWDFSIADVAEEGSFDVQFVATFGTGASPAKTFVTDWFVSESLA